jgi:galactokinase
VALVAAGDAGSFAQAVARDYEVVTGLRPSVYICAATNGAEVMT